MTNRIYFTIIFKETQPIFRRKIIGYIKVNEVTGNNKGEENKKKETTEKSKENEEETPSDHANDAFPVRFLARGPQGIN